MTLCLDTSTVVNVLRAPSTTTRNRFEAEREAGSQLVLSSLVFHELVYGAAISHRPAAHRRRLDETIGGLPVEAFGAADAVAASRVRHLLRVVGTPIGTMDSLIAGQALARGWSIVTANVRDFRRIDGLTVIDWSS